MQRQCLHCQGRTPIFTPYLRIAQRLPKDCKPGLTRKKTLLSYDQVKWYEIINTYVISYVTKLTPQQCHEKFCSIISNPRNSTLSSFIHNDPASCRTRLHHKSWRILKVFPVQDLLHNLFCTNWILKRTETIWEKNAAKHGWTLISYASSSHSITARLLAYFRNNSSYNSCKVSMWVRQSKVKWKENMQADNELWKCHHAKGQLPLHKHSSTKCCT